MIIAGADNITLSNNRIRNNVPSGPSIASGGVALIDTAMFGGSTPDNNLIQNNVVLNNQPYDLFSDQSGTGNVFRGNTCRTSSPPGLCASPPR